MIFRIFPCCASLLITFSSTGCIQAVTLEVKEGNSTCIKAELSATFSITYNTSSSTVCKETATPPSLKAAVLIISL